MIFVARQYNGRREPRHDPIERDRQEEKRLGEARMNADLQAVADALVELADAELRALESAANEFILCAAGFLSWLEHLADWELNRRDGLDFPLQPPHAAIPQEEHSASIEVASMLRNRFAQTMHAPAAVVGLFDAIVGVLAVGRARLQ